MLILSVRVTLPYTGGGGGYRGGGGHRDMCGHRLKCIYMYKCVGGGG